MDDKIPGGPEPDVMEMYDDTGAEPALICRVCGCLVAQVGGSDVRSSPWSC